MCDKNVHQKSLPLKKFQNVDLQKTLNSAWQTERAVPPGRRIPGQFFWKISKIELAIHEGHRQGPSMPEKYPKIRPKKLLVF